MCGPARCFDSRLRTVGSHGRTSNDHCSKCVNDSSRTRSSKTSPTLLTTVKRRLRSKLTALVLPEMTVLREITTEGEKIRDAIPDPKGRYLYLLGRRVHVYSGDGAGELRTIPIDDPMAVAVSAGGATLAVIAAEDYGNAKAT